MSQRIIARNAGCSLQFRFRASCHYSGVGEVWRSRASRENRFALSRKTDAVRRIIEL